MVSPFFRKKNLALCGPTCGCACSYKPVTRDELKANLMTVGLDEGTAGFVATLDANIAEGSLADARPDLAKLIGRPTTTLKETVKKIVR